LNAVQGAANASRPAIEGVRAGANITVVQAMINIIAMLCITAINIIAMLCIIAINIIAIPCIIANFFDKMP